MELWSVPLEGGVATRLDDGSADFCFDPASDPSSAQLAWQAWNVPHMPWDAARIERLDIASMQRATIVFDGALQQPRFLRDGRVICVGDARGFSNVTVDGRPVVEEPLEHAAPTWGLGQRSFAVSPDGRHVAFTRNERGFGRLCIAALDGSDVREVARGVHGQLSWEGHRLAALRTGARTPTQVVVYDEADGFRRSVLDIGPLPGWADVELAEPELVEVPVEPVDDAGSTVHARLYRADEPRGLICWVKGGPTDQWQVTFMPRIAFWRSRGWNVLVLDHRGSTGHGRAYQQALRGRWGQLDVDDTLAVIAHAHAQGWGTPESTALFGGSAGGFTVLGALAIGGRPHVSCAVVSYPVSDLADLAERSHRFERHYIATLVDPQQWAVRSPVTFAHRIVTPLLVLHGEDDPVVPVAQSSVLVERMRVRCAEVDLVVYPGEGHGFRRAEHQIDEYRRTEAFLELHMPVRG
jgi:dipeptidyl aminopeptidase/acylaminoacyl peptidase